MSEFSQQGDATDGSNFVPRAEFDALEARFSTQEGRIDQLSAQVEALTDQLQQALGRLATQGEADTSNPDNSMILIPRQEDLEAVAGGYTGLEAFTNNFHDATRPILVEASSQLDERVSPPSKPRAFLPKSPKEKTIHWELADAQRNHTFYISYVPVPDEQKNEVSKFIMSTRTPEDNRLLLTTTTDKDGLADTLDLKIDLTRSVGDTPGAAIGLDTFIDNLRGLAAQDLSDSDIALLTRLTKLPPSILVSILQSKGLRKTTNTIHIYRRRRPYESNVHDGQLCL